MSSAPRRLATRRQVLAGSVATAGHLPSPGPSPNSSRAPPKPGATAATAPSCRTPTACSTCRKVSATGCSPGRATSCAPARARSPATTTAWPPSPAATGGVHLVRNHENRDDARRSRFPRSRASPTTRWARAAVRRSNSTARHRARRARRHRRHGRQLRGRPHPLGHLADLRGDRGQGRHQRLHQGPRLHLRGGRRRPAPHRGRTADRDGPLPARGDRRRPAATASCTRPRTPSRSRSGSSTASCPRSRSAARARCARAARWRPCGCPACPTCPSIQETGASFDRIEWVPVPDPLAAETPDPAARTSARRASRTPRSWRAATGAARSVYFVSSFAHSAEGSAADHYGQVWRYEPKRRRLTLVVVFGPDTDIQLPGESPDNICLAAERRPDGLRGRRGRPARARGDAARRGLRDGARAGRTSGRPRSRSGASSRASRSRRTAARCT